MFDIGWPEILVIAVLTLLVVGPKDLPIVLKTVAQYVRKFRSMGREVTQMLEEAARDADLDEIKKTIGDVRSSTSKTRIEDFLNQEIGQSISQESAKTDKAANPASSESAPDIMTRDSGQNDHTQTNVTQKDTSQSVDTSLDTSARVHDRGGAGS